MRRLACLLLLAAGLLAQGGRDTGKAGKSILFVRTHKTTESGEIYRAAWSALEPHFVGEINRRRLADFVGDTARARSFFARHKDVVLVVAFGADAAKLTREILPKTAVLEVSVKKTAHVSTRVDREQFARLLKRFHPHARTIFPLPGYPAEVLPGFEGSADADLVWITDDTPGPFSTLTEIPEAPWVSTSPGLDGVLTVRPDPTSTGLKVVAQVVRKLRDRKPFERVTVARLRVTVDLRAAHHANYEVPLKFLARADVVRRAR